MNLQKSLLLVVDVQRGFMNESTEVIMPKVNTLIKRWEQRKWPVVYSRFINLEGSNWERLRDWHELKMEPDTLLAQGLTVVQPFIFKKSTYSAWSTEIASLSVTQGVRDIYIAGVDTNECVLATALAVFDAGYTPWIVKDCCASSGGSQPHDMALHLLQPLIGAQQIITSREVL